MMRESDKVQTDNSDGELEKKLKGPAELCICRARTRSIVCVEFLCELATNIREVSIEDVL